jgi:hypothetical protein
MKDKCRSAPCVAQFFGIVFIVVGLLGFLHNPIVGKHALFAANAAHNFLHIIVGAVLLASAKLGNSKMTLLVLGIVYILIGVLGYLMMKDKMFGLIAVNTADHYLHIVLGVFLIAGGAYVVDGKKKKK